MNDPEINLKRYLDTEGLLNRFFAAFDYCLSRCIQPALTANGNRPVAACCKKKYYMLYDLDHPAFERLRQERERLYGEPAQHHWVDPVSPCEYHNPRTGCLLATHKSPICLAFFCREGIDTLRSDYGIFTYDYLGVNYALEWILTGDFSDHHYREFRQSIVDMTEKVKCGPQGNGKDANDRYQQV